MVLWLEDQKIRHYKIEEREGLRDIESEEWNTAYDTYQRDLVSPMVEGAPNEQLNWLMSYAVRLEYADNGTIFFSCLHCTIAQYSTCAMFTYFLEILIY